MIGFIPILFALFMFSALFSFLIGRVSRLGRNVFVVVMFLIQLLIGVWMFALAQGGSPESLTFFGVKFVAGTLNSLVVLSVLAISFFAAVYSLGYMEESRRLATYFVFLFLFSFGMVGLSLAENLAAMYLFLELATISSAFLIAYPKGVAWEAGIKYIFICSIGSISVLTATAIVSGYFGAITLGDFRLAVLSSSPAASSLLKGVAVLFVVGYGLKAGAAPMHYWLPDAHAEAPTPISAMLSGALIEVAAFSLFRVLAVVNVIPSLVSVSYLIAYIGGISMIVGSILAFRQNDLKRMLAYSSVDQIGLVLIGIGLATPLALSGGFFQLINHMLMKSLLFLCVGVILIRTGTRKINELGGLARKMPITAAAFMIGAFAISGIPPLNGFFGPWLISLAAWQSNQPALTFIILAMAAVTLAYYAKVIRYVLLGRETEQSKNAVEASPIMLAPIIALVVLSIVIGLMPDLVLGAVKSGLGG